MFIGHFWLGIISGIWSEVTTLRRQPLTHARARTSARTHTHTQLVRNNNNATFFSILSWTTNTHSIPATIVSQTPLSLFYMLISVTKCWNYHWWTVEDRGGNDRGPVQYLLSPYVPAGTKEPSQDSQADNQTTFPYTATLTGSVLQTLSSP